MNSTATAAVMSQQIKHLLLLNYWMLSKLTHSNTNIQSLSSTMYIIHNEITIATTFFTFLTS